MTNDDTTVWVDLREKLARPFDPADVDFRPQMNGKGDAGSRVQAVCYIDARVVADRLDEVVGPGEWSFHYEPLLIERGEIQLAKGALTIHGVTKEDVGDGSTFATSKGCVSDALKRAAVLWGIGRYLYGLSTEWVTLDQHKRISDGDLAKLRARLPRPDGTPLTPQLTPQPAPAGAMSAEDEEKTQQHLATFDRKPPAQKAEPKLETLADVQQALMNYRNVLGIIDKSIITADLKLDYQAALARRSEYVEQWKRTSVERQKAGLRR